MSVSVSVSGVSVRVCVRVSVCVCARARVRGAAREYVHGFYMCIILLCMFFDNTL